MKFLALILFFMTNAWAGFGCPKILVKQVNEDKDKPILRGTFGLGDPDSIRKKCWEPGIFSSQPGAANEFGAEELEQFLANSPESKIDGLADNFLQQCFKEKGIGFKDAEDQRAVVADYYSLNNRLKDGGATLVEALQSLESTVLPVSGKWNDDVKKLTKKSFIPGVQEVAKEVSACQVSDAQRKENLSRVQKNTQQAVESIAAINDQINNIRCKRSLVQGSSGSKYNCASATDEKKLGDADRQKLEMMRMMKSSMISSNPILANEKLSRFVVETDNGKKSLFTKNASGGLEVTDLTDFNKAIEDHLRDNRDKMVTELKKYSFAAKCLNDESSDCSTTQLEGHTKTLPPAADLFTANVSEVQEIIKQKSAACASGNCIAQPDANMHDQNLLKLDDGILKQQLRDNNAANASMNLASCRDELRTNHRAADKVIFDSGVNLALSIPSAGFSILGRGLIGGVKGIGYGVKGAGVAVNATTQAVNKFGLSLRASKLASYGDKVANFAPKVSKGYSRFFFAHEAANLAWAGYGMHEAWDMCHESYTSSVISQANNARKTKQNACDENVKAAIPNQELQSCLMAVGMGALNLIPYAPRALQAMVKKLKPKLLDAPIPLIGKAPKVNGPDDVKLKADEPAITGRTKTPDEPEVNSPREKVKGGVVNGPQATSPEIACPLNILERGAAAVPSPTMPGVNASRWAKGLQVVTAGLERAGVVAGIVGMAAGGVSAVDALRSKGEPEPEVKIKLTKNDLSNLSDFDKKLAEWSNSKTGVANPPPEFVEAIRHAREVLHKKMGEIQAAK